MAATCTWTGGSANWNAASSNWSCASLPTSSDDVVINTTVTVTIAASTTADFSTLTVGGGSGTSTLAITGNIGNGGSITIDNRGVVTQNNTTEQVISGNLTIKGGTVGGKLNSGSNSTSKSKIVNFRIGGNLDIQSGTANGSINLDGLGYTGATGNATGNGGGGGHGYLSGDGGGAGHCGAGGRGNSTSGSLGTGGSANGSVANLSTMGSGGGGGSSTGASGGGLGILTVGGTMTVAGTLIARGATGSGDGGGGAGGGFRISANVLNTSGSPFISVAGGNGGSSGGGGGGGGCFQVSYKTSTNFTSTTVTKTGGSGGGGGLGGNAGAYSNNALGITVTESSGSTAATEGSSDTYTVALAAPPAADVTISVAASDTSYGCTVSPSSLTFTASDYSSAQTVTVTAVDDAIDEASPHSCTVTNTLSSSDPNYNGFSANSVVMSITDNDEAPTLSINDATVLESAGNAEFTVTLSAASGQAVSVDYATSNGTASAASDYSSTSGTLSFAAGETTKTISVPIFDDSTDDDDETFDVTLSNASNATISDATGIGTITDNDSASAPNLAISDVTVDEGDGTATVTVTMAGTSASTVSVDYATADNTALASSDYTSISGTLTWTAGQTGGKSFNVSISNDSTNEASESFSVNLSNASNATITRSQGEVTITDSDLAPSLSINDPSASEASGSLSYTVTLSAASGQTVTVSYASSNGTASAGSDYTETAGTLTFNPGETSKNIAVSLSDNSLDATDKTLVMTLSNASNATISDATGTGTITDDEATPSLTISDISSDEADGTAIITVTMTGSSASTVTVDYATANNSALAPSDYIAKSGTLTWTSGQTGDQSFAVDLSDDSLDENGESFFVNLSNASNATISDSQATVSISDNDDPPLVSIGDVSVSEADGTATFTVSLSAPSGLAVGVEYSTSNGTAIAGVDYDSTSGTLSFNPGETSQVIEVTILDNSVDEANRSFNVALSNASNATIGNGVGAGTIDDDEATPAASWSASSQNVLEGDGSVVVQANLSGASSQDVTLPFSLSGSAAPSSDYSVGVGSITIPAGQTSGSFSIILADDSAQEGSETIVVTMGTPTNASAGNPSAQTITISDNDSAGITVSKNSVTIAEGSDTATYTVQLNAQPSAEVVVHISSDNASTGCQTDKSSLTFSTSDWSSAQAVTISAVDDGLYEGSSGGACSITQTASSSDNAYNGIGVGSISVSIAENDSEPSIAFSADAQSASEGGSTLTVTAQLSAVSGVDTTLPLNFGGSATDGVDYSASGGSISIPAGQSSGSISITPSEDDTAEGGETILVSMGSPTNAVAGSPSTQTIALADNDDAGLQIGESGGSTAITEGGLTDTFTVKLSSKPTQNVTVTITPDAQCQADQSSLLFTDSDWDSNQTVTLTAVDDEIAEGSHACEVSITAASDDSMYAGLSDSLSLTVNDDDSAGISITQSGGSTSMSEGSGSDGIEIVLTSQPTADVTVTLSAGSQLHLSTGSLTFSAQNWQEAQSVEVTAEDDSIAEGNHQDSIGLSFASSDPNYQNFSASPISVDILDNDSAGYTLVASNAHPQVSTSGSVYTYTLALNSQPTGNVHIAIQPGSSLQASPSSLDFTTSDWASSKTVTIAYLTGDAQNGTVSHAMTSTDPAYDHLPVESITVEIIHDNPDDGDSGDGGDGGNGDPGDGGGGGGGDGGNESGGGGGSSGFSVHDRTLVAGGSLRLGGEASSGSFSWQILSGPGSLDDPHSSNPLFSSGGSGSTVIQQTFTNAQGESSSQTFTIHAVDSQSVGYETLASNLVLVMPRSGNRIIEGTVEGSIYLQGADWTLLLPAGVSDYELGYSSEGRLLLSFGGSVFISSSTEGNLSGEIDLRSGGSRQQFSEIGGEDLPEDFGSILASSDWGGNQSSEYLIGGGNRLYFFDSQLNLLGEIAGDAEHPIAGAGMDGQFIAAGPASRGFDEMLEYSGENPNNASDADILYLFDISELENGFDKSLEDADIRIQLGEGAYIQSYSLGDLDGDGHSDCAVAGSDGNTYIFLHLSLHEGETLHTSSAHSVIQGGSGSLFIEDVSGDDLRDLIIGLPEAQGGVGEIVIFFGGNAWESTLEIASAQALHILGREADGKIGTDFISADMDGDGATDLITVNAFEQRILIDLGDGMQAAPPNYLEGGCSLQKEPSRPPIIPFALILSWITAYGFARRRINPKSS